MTDHHIVLRVVAKVLIPIITIYGFYVHFHGEYSPGGGFQAGVILAVALVLYSLIFGISPTMKAVTPGFARGVAGLGFLLYAGVGVWAMLAGGNYLEYNALLREEPGGHIGQHMGIILIEIGVLMAVAGAMVSIYYAFAGRVTEIRDEDW